MIAWVPELICVRGSFESTKALVCDAAGKILKLVESAGKGSCAGRRRCRLAHRLASRCVRAFWISDGSESKAEEIYRKRSGSVLEEPGGVGEQCQKADRQGGPAN